MGDDRSRDGAYLWILQPAGLHRLRATAGAGRLDPTSTKRDRFRQPSRRRTVSHRAVSFMLTYVSIAAGGALGSMARYAVSGSVASAVNEVFPWGTLAANVSGCFVIGLFAMLTGPDGRLPVAPDFRQFFMVGVCGGYTTFSSFSLQTLALARAGDMTRASANVVASLLLCLLGVWLGAVAGAAINQLKGP